MEFVKFPSAIVEEFVKFPSLVLGRQKDWKDRKMGQLSIYLTYNFSVSIRAAKILHNKKDAAADNLARPSAGTKGNGTSPLRGGWIFETDSAL